jgi:hypothetical protein
MSAGAIDFGAVPFLAQKYTRARLTKLHKAMSGSAFPLSAHQRRDVRAVERDQRLHVEVAFREESLIDRQVHRHVREEMVRLGEDQLFGRIGGKRARREPDGERRGNGSGDEIATRQCRHGPHSGAASAHPFKQTAND